MIITGKAIVFQVHQQMWLICFILPRSINEDLTFVFDTLLFMHSENAIFPSRCREERKETNENQYFVD
ncbi:hypothetical protein DWX97_15925 [Bacteroides cellulosilyticus]|uniref:Uncharacterized protein n=1 Tax=Bacteroides cellulosilyticus TaxID=246787 RepID=A0A3D6ARQ4_9BACE|nr:hypothetical protein DWZ09_13300 [Bacteroides cellulosilyticus]RGS35405.1 hypothetical protein DWX97_15925 [Bacteroides cellulosilyticus]HCY69471.1 hypothetical protein [Bacteroides cellulosilyticus]